MIYNITSNNQKVSDILFFTMTAVLPIKYDPTSKTISLEESVPLSSTKDFQIEVSQINTLYSDFIKTNSELPPPPTKEAFTQNLSMMVKKMHESAVLLMRQKSFEEAAKKFDIALGLASARSKFESFQATLPELMICLIGRCDAYTNAGFFVEALEDAEVLILLGSTIPDNHLRRGICKLNLGDFVTAKSDFERGLAFNSKHPILLKLYDICKKLIDEENGDV